MNRLIGSTVAASCAQAEGCTMKAPLIALVLLATPAMAATTTPKEHALRLTDSDLQALAYAQQHVGEHCASDPTSCQAQLALNDMVRRLGAQLEAEQRAEAVKATIDEAAKPKPAH